MECPCNQSSSACIWLLKYTPAVCTMLMAGHVGLLILGHNYYFAEMLAGASVVNSALMFALSTRFHFCMLHRLLIAYPLIVELCIILQRFNFFGEYVSLARWIVFLVGTTLFVCGIVKLRKARIEV